jgi:hypothetical protein
MLYTGPLAAIGSQRIKLPSVTVGRYRRGDYQIIRIYYGTMYMLSVYKQLDQTMHTRSLQLEMTLGPDVAAWSGYTADCRTNVLMGEETVESSSTSLYQPYVCLRRPLRVSQALQPMQLVTTQLQKTFLNSRCIRQ